jgi:hypothetical protein
MNMRRFACIALCAVAVLGCKGSEGRGERAGPTIGAGILVGGSLTREVVSFDAALPEDIVVTRLEWTSGSRRVQVTSCSQLAGKARISSSADALEFARLCNCPELSRYPRPSWSLTREILPVSRSMMSSARAHAAIGQDHFRRVWLGESPGWLADEAWFARHSLRTPVVTRSLRGWIVSRWMYDPLKGVCLWRETIQDDGRYARTVKPALNITLSPADWPSAEE